MRGHSPDTDTHVVVLGADGRDFTIRLAGSFPRAAGEPMITELAQPSHLHYRGFWKRRRERGQTVSWVHRKRFSLL